MPFKNIVAPYRLPIAASLTPFLDGYVTAAAVFLILLISDLSPYQVGVFASIYIFCFSVGSFGFGLLADFFGRRRLFLLSMGSLLGVSLLGAILFSLSSLGLGEGGFGVGFLLLLVWRGCAGFLLGGDYPVGQALITEQGPEAKKSWLLSLLMFGWYVGAIFGIVLSWPMLSWGLSWVVHLWVITLLTLLALWARWPTSESNLWTVSARGKRASRMPLLNVFPNRHTVRNFLFCACFWVCQIIPATVLMYYVATILSDMLGLRDTFLQVLLLYGSFFLGVLPATHPAVSSRPKLVLVLTFWIMTGAIFGLHWGLADRSAWFTGITVFLFAVSYGLQTTLNFVYPNLLFPTPVRASLVGLTTMLARFAAMGAAFAFPLLAARFPVDLLLDCGAAILALGALFSMKWAPADPVKPVA